MLSVKECGPEKCFQTEVCIRLRCFKGLQQTRLAFQRKVAYLHNFTVCHNISYLHVFEQEIQRFLYL